MCNVSGQMSAPLAATATGAAPAAQAAVAGASGGGASVDQSLQSTANAVGGATGGAVAGAANVAGGGADLTSLLQSLNDVVAQLAKLVEQMAGGTIGGGGGCGCGMSATAVNGVRGSAAQKKQYVAAPIAGNIRNSEDHEYEQRVLELVNQERAKYGLKALTYDSTLDAASEKHAAHMASVGRMAHDGIGDGTPGGRIRAEGFRNAWGENVATGQRSPEQVVREWMNSPTHRRNILDGSFSKLGVSYETASSGRSYWAQSFGR